MNPSIYPTDPAKGMDAVKDALGNMKRQEQQIKQLKERLDYIQPFISEMEMIINGAVI